MLACLLPSKKDKAAMVKVYRNLCLVHLPQRLPVIGSFPVFMNTGDHEHGAVVDLVGIYFFKGAFGCPDINDIQRKPAKQWGFAEPGKPLAQVGVIWK